eukprot:COSAG05_NODE_5714_length_1109_cov_1.467327_2_plen_155_part_00
MVDRQLLTKEQLSFINSFGFLVLPGLMADTIDRITQAFSEVWEVDTGGFPRRPGFGNRGPGMVHNDTGRTWLGPFIDQHPTLCALLDDPRIDGIFTSLLGDDYTYYGSDGNFFAGNTGCEIHCMRYRLPLSVHLVLTLDCSDKGRQSIYPPSIR